MSEAIYHFSFMRRDGMIGSCSVDADLCMSTRDVMECEQKVREYVHEKFGSSDDVVITSMTLVGGTALKNGASHG